MYCHKVQHFQVEDFLYCLLDLVGEYVMNSTTVDDLLAVETQISDFYSGKNRRDMDLVHQCLIRVCQVSSFGCSELR